ncbi:hypothetical protein ATCV1_z102R [Acanthocystis turfacea chlorella virus 1]|uniref:Uncharacterized protein z102R n=1 Tax=Chlorovirus heliozoae TaxID=322019 RepID=A7K862_9PHYC|nr:hypothetical protein ATCV1_z102R [Acanthocystis turfacea chlorella virus 1]ABT16236.1 hypothetical protein ATCV1_z102R [Acanthocystis turfacea chlorella virus 1]
MGTVLFREFARGLHRCKVNILKDFPVEVLGRVRVKRHAQLEEHVLKTLDTHSNWAPAHVTSLRLGNCVGHDVNALVEVLGQNLHVLAKVLKVVGTVLDVVLEDDASNDTHRRFVRRSVFDNLGTKIAARDGAGIGLHVLHVHAVLVEHVRHARLDLRDDHRIPDIARFDDFLRTPLGLVAKIQVLVLLAKGIG